MNPFQSLRDYEEFVYTLAQRFPSIEASTLIIVRRGARTAILRGELTLAGGYRIGVTERMSFDDGPVVIEDYGYEIWHGSEKVAWYDAQPHPEDPSLAESFPHHKHIHPDIKHHRVPANDMGFDNPNLPFLIAEVEDLANP